MTGKKYLTALVFLPLFALLVLALPPWPFELFVVAALTLTLLELYGLLGRRSDWRLPLDLQVVAVTLQLCILAAMSIHGLVWATATMTLSVVILGLYGTICCRDLQHAPIRLAICLFGIMYVGWLLGHLILLRSVGGGVDGSGFAAAVFLIVWLGDAAALHVGKKFGKRKLAPVLSPGKSVAGLLGGVAANVVAGGLAKLIFIPQVPWLHCFVLGGVMGIVAHGGDLVESMFKRSVRTKDSADWIPGHGGLLDRIDSLAFSVPVVYYYYLLILTA